MLTLPDGTAFPDFRPAGAMAHPVVRLYGAQGQMLARYADFIGNDRLEDYIPSSALPDRRNLNRFAD